MAIGLLRVRVLLPGCASLKEKRGRIRPLLARWQREFNVSCAELDLLDARDETVLGCACLSNEAIHSRQVLERALTFARERFPDLEFEEHRIENV